MTKETCGELLGAHGLKTTAIMAGNMASGR